MAKVSSECRGIISPKRLLPQAYLLWALLLLPELTFECDKEHKDNILVMIENRRLK